MKRSEAINVIHDILVDIVIDVVPNFPLLRDISLDDASRILEKMEQAGMLPPTTKLGHINATDNAWEPEDV